MLTSFLMQCLVIEAGNENLQSASSRDVQTTRDFGNLQQLQTILFENVVRPKYWKVLTKRLSPMNILDELFGEEVISCNLMEKIRKTPLRKERVDILLDHVSRMNDKYVKTFATVLSETEGIKDVGHRLLEDIEQYQSKNPP